MGVGGTLALGGQPHGGAGGGGVEFIVSANAAAITELCGNVWLMICKSFKADWER